MDERTRIEVAFQGGAAVGVLVSGATADALERALEGGNDGAFKFEAEDGQYTLALSRIVYVKRFARDSRVGFGAA